MKQTNIVLPCFGAYSGSDYTCTRVCPIEPQCVRVCDNIYNASLEQLPEYLTSSYWGTRVVASERFKRLRKFLRANPPERKSSV